MYYLIFENYYKIVSVCLWAGLEVSGSWGWCLSTRGQNWVPRSLATGPWGPGLVPATRFWGQVLGSLVDRVVSWCGCRLGVS